MQLSGIDLHTHTTASDGSLTPTELVERAAKIGLTALAITDHDTVAGLAEGLAAASRLGIALLTGVELTVEDSIGRFHLLGYGFDHHNPTLENALIERRERRVERNRKIMQKAADLNLPITWDDVLAHVGDGGEVVARPHIAAALIDKGVVGSIQEAFDKYLTSGRPLYAPKDALSPTEAARLLHETGGVAVMAHPVVSRWSDPQALRERLRPLRDEAGLDGLEAFYSLNSPEQTDSYLRIAEELGLIVTGGSDFHGAPKPLIPLGVVHRGGPAPASLLDALPNPVNAIRPTAA